MGLRWKPFVIGALAGGALAAALVLLRRREQAPAPFVLDQLALGELGGEWYELAVSDAARAQDWVGTKFFVEDGSLSAAYRLESFDAPEQGCRTRLQRLESGAADGRLRLGQREIWIVELAEGWLAAATPDRSALWVLGRMPELPDAQWASVRERLQAQGFDPERLARTPHQG